VEAGSTSLIPMAMNWPFGQRNRKDLAFID